MARGGGWGYFGGMNVGRVEVHSHLLAGVDDGCRTMEEAVECAGVLVGAGYGGGGGWGFFGGMNVGRVEVHSHWGGGVDEGCGTMEGGGGCAGVRVGGGYGGVVCTPHVLPMYPHNTREGIGRGVAALQRRLDLEGVGLRVWPGGELTLASRGSPTVVRRREDVITYGFLGRWVLFDFWEEDGGEAWGKLE